MEAAYLVYAERPAACSASRMGLLMVDFRCHSVSREDPILSCPDLLHTVVLSPMWSAGCYRHPLSQREGSLPSRGEVDGRAVLKSPTVTCPFFPSSHSALCRTTPPVLVHQHLLRPRSKVWMYMPSHQVLVLPSPATCTPRWIGEDDTRKKFPVHFIIIEKRIDLLTERDKISQSEASRV